LVTKWEKHAQRNRAELFVGIKDAIVTVVIAFPRGNICDVGDFRDTHILESIERSHNALRQLASFHNLVTTRRDHLFEVYHLSPGGAFSFLSSILILISHYNDSATPIAVDDLSLIRIFSLIDTTL